MSAIVPSQICSFIDSEFKYISRENTPLSQMLRLSNTTVCGSLRALIALVERLPNSLLPTDPFAFGELVSSVETIKYAVALAERLTAIDLARGQDVMLVPKVAGKLNPVLVIRTVLDDCPDESAAIESQDFLFVKDRNVRAELLADLASARSALQNSEWKPATVIAGSIAEALLLWALDQRAEEIEPAVASAISSGGLKAPPPSDRERWGLEQFIAVAKELCVIDSDTLSQLKITQGFRNLIHPGRARRTDRRCDRGTALAANASVELLARDLQARFS